MAGSPHANRLVQSHLGTLDVATSGSLTVISNDLLASPVRVHRVIYQVVFGVTTAVSGMTLSWRPTPGSATDEVELATWNQPVEAEGTCGEVDFNLVANVVTTIGAGGEFSAYGLGGSRGITQGNIPLIGPGGQFVLATDGGSDDGFVNYWLEAEILSQHNTPRTTAPTKVVPVTVG